MTTFGNLVDQVASMLSSYSGAIEQNTWLTENIDAADLAFTVNDGLTVSQGVSEIEDELIYVVNSDETGVTLAPFGRGYQGTTAANHTANTKLTFNPIFPRVEIKRAINQTLLAVYPQLYAIKEHTFLFNGSIATYEMPADTESILKVTFELTGVTNVWPTIRGWEFAPNSEEASGKAIELLESAVPGQTVKVVYTAAFPELTDTNTTLSSIGFPASAEDVLTYGAVSRLLRWLDVRRLQLDSVENLSRGMTLESGDASKIANQMFALYQQRLNEERRKLLILTPPSINTMR